MSKLKPPTFEQWEKVHKPKRGRPKRAGTRRRVVKEKVPAVFAPMANGLMIKLSRVQAGTILSARSFFSGGMLSPAEIEHYLTTGKLIEPPSPSPIEVQAGRPWHVESPSTSPRGHLVNLLAMSGVLRKVS